MLYALCASVLFFRDQCQSNGNDTFPILLYRVLSSWTYLKVLCQLGSYSNKNQCMDQPPPAQPKPVPLYWGNKKKEALSASLHATTAIIFECLLIHSNALSHIILEANLLFLLYKHRYWGSAKLGHVPLSQHFQVGGLGFQYSFVWPHSQFSQQPGCTYFHWGRIRNYCFSRRNLEELRIQLILAQETNLLF